MYFWIIILFNLFLFFGISAPADVEEQYSRAAQGAMELLRGKTCEDMHSDGKKQCVQNKSNPKELQQHSQTELEKIYFQKAAESEVENLQCSLKKVQEVEKSKEAKLKILADFKAKIPAIRAKHKEILRLQEGEFTSSSKTTSITYDKNIAKLREGMTAESRARHGLDSAQVSRDQLAKKEEQLLKAQSEYNALISSLWMGGTRATTNLVVPFIMNESKNIETLDQNFDEFISQLSEEFKNDHETLLGQSSLDKTGKRIYDLNSAAREQVVRDQFNIDRFAEELGLTPSAEAVFSCNIQDRYTRGRTVLRAEAFVGMTVLTGGYFLVARIPTAAKLAMGAGTKAGQMSANGAKVMFFSALGTSTATHTYMDYRRECESGGFHNLREGETCNSDIEGQFRSIDEGNCALSLVFDFATAVPVATFGAIQTYVSSVKLARDVKRAVDYEKMASLTDAQRKSLAKRLVPGAFKGKSRAEQEKRLNAIIEAHSIGGERGFFTYTAADLRAKTEILKNAGFTKEERRLLMEKGVTGRFEEITSSVAGASQFAKDRIAHIQDHVVSSVDDAKRIAAMRSDALRDLMNKIKLSAAEEKRALEEAGLSRFESAIDTLKLRKIRQLLSDRDAENLVSKIRMQFRTSSDDAQRLVASLLGERARKDVTVMAGNWLDQIIENNPVSKTIKMRTDIEKKAKPTGEPLEFHNPKYSNGQTQKYIYEDKGTRFEIVTCHKEPCPDGITRGEVITAYPICGPSVYQIPATVDLLGSPDRLKSSSAMLLPCKH